MATTIYVALQSGNSPPTPWSYNKFDDATGVQTLSSDLNDDVNASTGYSLDVTTAFSASSGSVATANVDVGDWDDLVLDEWYASNGAAELEIGGLTQDDTYSLELMGHNISSGRHTDYTVTPANEGETRYVTSADPDTITSPVTFTGTIGAAGTINIVGAVVSTFWYISGFKLTITAAAGGAAPNTLTLLGVG